jgi:putative redox protein
MKIISSLVIAMFCLSIVSSIISHRSIRNLLSHTITTSLNPNQSRVVFVNPERQRDDVPTSPVQSLFEVTCLIGGHTVISDQGHSKRGDDLGPTPKELLLSALGGCTRMTMQTVFFNSKWSNSTLDNVSVIVEEHMTSDDTHTHIPCSISMHITLSGNLSRIQRDSLFRAAAKCPVKNMISDKIRIDIIEVQEQEK